MQFLKIKALQKSITILTVLALLQPYTVIANDGIFLNTSSARKVASELDYCFKSQAKDANIISLLKEENNKYLKLSDTYKEKVSLIQKDKEILKKRGDDFEKQYKATSKDLNECIENTPSRLVWYGIGFLTAFILGVGTIFMIKK